ncbi:hypothetical protein LTR85_011973 [Meristemomyces frigidus]|nr:hypothetical protein LTR85_011973 [Meristemomyces frigidus]
MLALIAHDRHVPAFSRFLQFANPTFDVSVFEIFFPLYRGVTLVTCERRRLLNNLSGVITELDVDAAELTPSVAATLLNDRQSVPSLQLLLTIGEMLKRSVVEEFAGDDHTQGILYGMYGPTEATIHCTLQTSFTKSMPINNIGTPLDTVSAFVVKPASTATSKETPEVVPIGEEGELALGGHQLADGYLNRDEQTRAAFVHHPQFGRLYRTGDRAVMTTEGKLECLGRISSGQVKLRGQRIELGEIEYAATQTAGCRSAVAEVLDGALVAFCVCSQTNVTIEDMRQSCRKWLPAFMVPNDFVFLDALPYLASGKLDRKALSGHYTKLKRPPSATDAASPRAMEIAVIVSGVLRVDINSNTHLPATGLDSLAAIRIASLLNRSGFPQLDANAVIEAQNVRDLEGLVAQAERINEPLHDATHSECDTAVLRNTALHHPLLQDLQEEVEHVFAATPVQSAMLSETARDPQAYCNWIVFDVADIIHLPNIEVALRQLSTSHEMLRSGFLTVQAAGVGHLVVVVVWKRLPASHVVIVEDFDYGFTMQTEEEALRPCCFQVTKSGGRARILLKIHHASYDQWSVDILKDDLTRLLQDSVTELVVPFSKVSGFHASVQKEGRSDGALDFWEDHLRDFVATPIPDLNGRAVPRSLLRTLWRTVSFDIQGARNHASDLGYSLPSVFQAALAYLIAAYAGSQDVVFGTVFSGRHVAIPGIERAFGPCLATLPCRIDLSSVRSCLDLLRATHDGNRALQRHSLTPLAEIKKAGHCMPGMTLFDALFVWQESSVSPQGVDPLIIEIDSADHHEFNLVLEFAPSTEDVAIRATYQQSLLSTQHVDLILRQLEVIVKHLLQHFDAPVESLLSVFSEDSLSISNTRPSFCASMGDPVTAIEHHAKHRPNSLALSFAQDIGADTVDVRSLTYAELNSRANRLAHYLQSLGIAPNELIGICMEKSFDLYIAILAAVKCGAGYLPLIPETPKARIELILRQAKVKVCLCDAVSIDMVKSVSAASAVEPSQLDLRHLTAENPGVCASGSDLAYTVFTSGSTGEPKGVSVTRDNLAGNLAALSELYHAVPGDRLLQACSQAFDVSVFEILYGLSTGMCLCTGSKEILFRDLERSIRALDVTHLSLTPTVAALVEPDNVPNVHFLVTAGEAMTDIVHRRWAGRGLHQGYGPSETTNICTVNMAMASDDALGNIGKPLRNTSAFVLSLMDEFAPLPVGAIGELAFGGEQVFRGYLGRDDLSAVKLLNHPIFGRIYRSGDVGRMLSDGTLLIVGRLDDQVKLRGNRIELGEINAAMLQNTKVLDCSTLLVEDDRGQSLAAFWVPGDPQASSTQQTRVGDVDRRATARLFEHLDATLPSYMIPTLLIPITRMPMTAQGKLDQRLLRQMLSNSDETSRQMFSREVNDAESDAWCPHEERLATALAETLRLPASQLRRTTSFFALGLNSLSAIAFAKAAEASLRQRVSISTVLRNPSIARLGAALTRDDAPSSQARADVFNLFLPDFISRVRADCEAQGLEVENVLPCTPLQEAMLSATATHGTSAYQNLTTYMLLGDVAILKQCWTVLMARHAILRTHFVDTDHADHPFAQAIIKQKNLPWHIVHSDQNDSVSNCRPPMSEPFRIEIRRSSEKMFMTVHMHHAIYDGMAMTTLQQEAEELYHGTSLSATPVSIDPFLAETMAQNGSEAMRYWSAQIDGFEPKPFPRPTHTGSVAQRTRRRTPAIGANDMSAFCKRHSVTPLSVFQTAWAKVLSIAQQADDICFGAVVSGRSVAVAGIDKLVAPCFNTLPLRADLSRYSTNIQLAKRLHTRNIEDTGFQLTSLRRIQRSSRSPEMHLFDSILILQPPQQALDTGIWKLESEEGTMDVPIVLEIVPKGHGFELALHFLAPHIAEDLADHLLQAHVSAVASCLRYPSSDVHSFGETESSQVIGSLKTPQRYSETKATDHAPMDEDHNAWTPQETKVREVFANFSGLDQTCITRMTSMFRLGLDSLNAAQVAARLRKVGLQVDATDVIENLTPSAISAAAAKHQPSVEARPSAVDLTAFDRKHRQLIVSSAGIDPESIEAVRPCTAVQCGMIAQSLQSRGSLYVNHITYGVPDGIKLSDVSGAWSVVQQKHQAVRMGFCHIDDPSKPFAMILWKSNTTQEPVSHIHSDEDGETVEIRAASGIVAKLHAPAWRLSLTGSGRLMVLSLHHAVYDAESLQYLLSDFEKAVDGLRDSTGNSPTIDRLLTTALTAEAIHSDEAATFWRDLLAGASSARFPNLSPTKPQGREMLSIVQKCRLRTSSIDRYCKTKGATVQAVGQAAWGLLLSAYTGEHDVLFGTVFSGRSGPKDQSIVFPSISTVPVRCVSGKPEADIVADMVAYNSAVHRHRFTPLADIQRFAGAAGQSLFDTVFVYQKTSSSSQPRFSWPTIRETAAVDYVASMELEMSSSEITIRLTVDSSHIPGTQAELLVLQYDQMLSQLTGHSGMFAGDLCRINSISPAKEASLPSNTALLHQFVEFGAQEHPDRPALEFLDGHALKDKQTWTYKQLNERGNQVAHLLRQRGVGEGNIIAVRMQKCPEASFAFLGILKAGCSFLALDPDLPEARQHFILQDSNANILFTDRLSTTIGGVEVLQLIVSSLDQYPQESITLPMLGPDATCYCLYTSGTTGTPKGCEISHENAVQAMLAFQRLFAGHWDQESRWLQFASYWFDVSVLEQFWSWSVGITVVGAPRDVVLDDLAGFIRQAQITHIDLTPSLARLLHPDDVPSLQNGVFITGGEALKQEIIDAWGSKHTICNGYGPTEATIGVTMNTFIGTDAKPSNIGMQFDNVGAYVFAPGTSDPVLRGAVGELCVSGKLVGKGYLNRPELTAKAFPYLPQFGERVYRTGDLVRMLADGSFSFLGRIDTQAKLRGQRLEVAEIDSVIAAASEKIADVVSLVHKDETGGKETLVSFITTGAARNSKDCRIDATHSGRQLASTADRACRGRLPAYMVPTHLIPITFLPLTVNNKVDTKRLIALFDGLTARDLQGMRAGRNDDGPMTGSERRVSEVLTKMLGLDIDVVQRDSNVFSLGISSISAITFASLLKRKGFVAANVALVMRNPTISHLAHDLSGSERSAHDEDSQIKQAQLSMTAFAQRHRSIAARRLCVSPGDIETVTPCTPLQEGLLLESMSNSKRPYFNDFRYLLGNLDLEQLRRAFEQLTASVQILRAKYVQTEDGYVQVVLKESQVPWRCHPTIVQDAETLISEERSQWLEDNQADLVQPIKALVVPTADGEMFVVFVHHALYDGISWQLLLDRLARCYNKHSPMECGPTFTDALAYGPLCSREGAKPFWQHHLSPLSFDALPHAPLDSVQSVSSAISRISDMTSVEAIRKKLGVSHQAFLQACFEVVLVHHYPGTRTYGHVVSGRSIGLDGADQVIGPLFNTLPQKITLGTEDTWSTAVRHSHDANVAALPFQHTSLREIRKWCKLMPADQMFEVLFVFQHQPRHDAAREFGLWEEIESEPHADYPLAVEVTLLADNTLELVAVSQSNVADEASLNALLASLQKAIVVASNDVDRCITDVFSIPQTEEPQPAYGHPKAQPDLNGVHDFTWTDKANVLREAIAQIAGLDIESVDEHSTIFSVGLDSIDAVKLASKAKRAGLALPVSKILQAQTIPRMLDAARATKASAGPEESRGQLEMLEEKLSRFLKGSLTHDDTVERILPATPSQEALIADMHRSNWRDYYNHDVLRLLPGVDMDRLRTAWQTVVAKAPILRTAFVPVTDPSIEVTFAQVVYRPCALTLQEHTFGNEDDLGGLLKQTSQDACTKSVSEPPLRLALATVGDKRYLVLSLAHAQYDGHSLALLHEDIQRAYYGVVDERPPYNAVIEASMAATNEDARNFWSNALSGATVSSFPHVDGSDVEVTHRAEKTSAVSAAAARDFCRQHGVSIQALAQTCWALVLAHYARSLEVVYGVVLACRDSEEAEQIMFPTMNTVPVRAALHGSRSDMLRYMQSIINDMHPYQQTPLRTIKAACPEIVQKDSSTGGGSLFDTLFIYQHRPESSQDNTQPLYESTGGSSSVEYPVAVEIETVADQLLLRTACKSSVLDRGGTERLLDHVDCVLSTIVISSGEPTVSFSDSELSVCGLPWFQLPSDVSKTDDATIVSEAGDGNTDPLDQELSPDAVIIREALAQVAKIAPESIAPTASIESIGVDSISAIKVAALLRRQGISLSVSEIIRARTFAKMADVATSKSEPSETAAVPSKDVVAGALSARGFSTLPTSLDVDHANVEAILPATAGQVYMLSVWKASNGQLFYPTFSYELQAAVDVEQLRCAWKELVARHAILRTVFCATEDEQIPLLQIVLKETVDSFHEGERCPSDEDGSQPMLALHVTKHGETYRLRLRIHHALYDAVSLPLLMQDFKGLLTGVQSDLPAIRQESFLALSVTKPAQEARQAFWTSYLKGVKPMRFVQPSSGGTQKRVEIFKPGLFTEAAVLEELARKEGVTIQALLFAAYAKVYTGLAVVKDDNAERAEDVVLGIYLANRSHLPELDQLTAATLNLVPLLVRSPRQRSLLDVAKQIQTDLQEIGTAQNSAVGLWEIAEWTGVKVDTFVNFLKLPEQHEDGGTAAEQNGVVLRETGERTTAAYARVTEPDDDIDFKPPKELQQMKLADAYQHSLDLEATVANGALDIGVFCPEAMLGLEVAEKVVEEMRLVFEKLIGEAAA